MNVHASYINRFVVQPLPREPPTSYGLRLRSQPSPGVETATGGTPGLRPPWTTGRACCGKLGRLGGPVEAS
eukprot:2202258-Pyramimonas_sp.AAC.1